jgi:succinate dehydrogenase / fumarate reductase iron-sulfur subunit
MGKTGIQGCDNTQNCVRVCPQEIPITTAIAKVKREATLQTLKNFFG